MKAGGTVIVHGPSGMEEISSTVSGVVDIEEHYSIQSYREKRKDAPREKLDIFISDYQYTGLSLSTVRVLPDLRFDCPQVKYLIIQL